MSNLAWRVCLGALPVLQLLLAQPAAVAQTDSSSHATKQEELEKAVVDITNMFANDPRYNRGKTREQIKDGVEFVTGNVLFVLGHETAHALISVFDLPVLGREEDAADTLATVVALKMANAFADRVVVNAARGWFLSDRQDKKDGTPASFYDDHGLDLQRAYYIVCLMVGAAPDKFTNLANEVKLPKERQSDCKFEYNNISWSWGEVLKPHKRKPDDPKTKIEVRYNPTKEFATISELGRKLQILEAVAEWLSEDFAWKTPISLEMDECGSPDTRWIAAKKTIVVCYEMIREFVQLHRDYGQMALVPGGAMKMTKSGKIVAVKPSKSRNGKAYRSERARR
jgi:hypothetical protein